MSQAAGVCAEEKSPRPKLKTHPDCPPRIQPCWWYNVKKKQKPKRKCRASGYDATDDDVSWTFNEELDSKPLYTLAVSPIAKTKRGSMKKRKEKRKEKKKEEMIRGIS